MTKTLTEQWRNGTLKGGIYYLLLRDGTTVTDKTVYIVGEKQLRWSYSSFDFVKEVLAAVPSYEKFVELTEKVESMEKQLKEAEEALKDFCEDCTLSKCGGCDEDCAGWKAKEYLERYGVK